ncbi:FxsA family protein [Rhodococcus chondri]|uniref:FxsA family protein n=1 Tax=Rhodococcus chondri TaxID=3065941 RepID=A0ABU7JZX6_9NOCA|nr:FxsA family protein [Rhodococcus sp. CC-R104]MEE2035565.1 FxsA family protein [Rhodococcus sp. CC-R104]
MYLLLFAAYVVAEIAVLAWLGSVLGAAATIVLFLAVSIAGYAVLGAQGRRALDGLGKLRGGTFGSAASVDAVAGRMVTDVLLIGVGAALVLLPGLLTTALGVLLLLPTRALLRPAVRALAARHRRRHGTRVRGARLVVVDGQVVDHTVVGLSPHLTAPTGPPRPGAVIDGEILDPPQPPTRP